MAVSYKSSVWLNSGIYDHTGGTVNTKTLVPRPISSIGYVVSGTMEFVWNSGERRVFLSEGDVYFVPRLASYTIKCYSDTVFTAVHFNFHNKTAIAAFRNADIQKLPPDEDMRADIDYIFKNSERNDCGFDVMSRFFGLADSVSGRLVRSSRKPLDERIVKAISMLEAKLGQKQSIDEIAAECHMSTSHFYDIFKKETGCSPIEYKNRAAIDYAAQLLIENPKMSVDALSEKVGFESASYFRRVFKAYTGISPREYRRIENMNVRQ